MTKKELELKYIKLQCCANCDFCSIKKMFFNWYSFSCKKKEKSCNPAWWCINYKNTWPF